MSGRRLAGAPGRTRSRAGAELGPAEAEELVDTVATELDQDWADLFAQLGETFAPPAANALDDRTRETGCAPVAAGDVAVACVADRTIYLDQATLIRVATAYPGPASVLPIAHGYGLHVLNLLAVESSGRDRELQAACLAGISIWYADTEGVLALTPGVIAGYFYETAYPDGEPLADAFALGDETYTLADCFAEASF